jgi:hypothetical protein
MAVAGARPRLRVWRTVAGSYALTFRYLGYLLRISWAWVVLMIPISLAYYASVFWLGWQTSSFPDVLSTFLFLPFLASISVAWHRRLLLNDVWSGRIYMRFDGPVVSYLGLSVVLSILFPALAIAATSSADAEWPELLTGVLLATAGLFLSTKIWLALPARALGDSEITIRQAWSGSRQNVWRLIAGSSLCSLPILVLAVLAETFGPDLEKTSEPLTYAAWQTLLEIGGTFLAEMPNVSFLSLAYRHLMQEREPADLLRSE